MDFAVLAKHRVKIKENQKRVKYRDFARKLKKQNKPMEHKGDIDIDCNWCAWNNPQRLGEGTGRIWNQRVSGDHTGYSIIKIGQNTEKSPGDLKRL